jgi:hypothetical protein
MMLACACFGQSHTMLLVTCVWRPRMPQRLLLYLRHPGSTLLRMRDLSYLALIPHNTQFTNLPPLQGVVRRNSFLQLCERLLLFCNG